MNPALLPMFLQSGSAASAWLIKAGIALLLVLVFFGAGAAVGYQWRDGEVAQLEQAASTEADRANASNSTLASLKALLATERERRNQMQQAVEAELAARANRIAQLQVAAERRRTTLNTEASKDEDCNALRRQPVCAALARGLWPDAGSAAAH